MNSSILNVLQPQFYNGTMFFCQVTEGSRMQLSAFWSALKKRSLKSETSTQYSLNERAILINQAQ